MGTECKQPQQPVIATPKPTKEQRAIVFKKIALSILKRKAKAKKEEFEKTKKS